MAERIGRKRGGERSVDTSLSKADRARLEKVRDDWYAHLGGYQESPLFQAVKEDMVSHAIGERKKAEPGAEFSKGDIEAMRSKINSSRIITATKEFLLSVLLKEQHNAQLSGKSKQEKVYRPDIATLVDAVGDLSPQAAKKFLRTRSATFLLEHHQQAIAQRIREMAGKEALLKPVEFIAETNDPAYYVGKLFYKGSFSKVSIIEENCVGTESNYFEESKVDPGTGRSTTEIFVVMKRWEKAGPDERRQTVERLLEDDRIYEAIVDRMIKIQNEMGIDEAHESWWPLSRAVGQSDDSIEAGFWYRKKISANDLLYRATADVLNKETPLLNFHLMSNFSKKDLIAALTKLPKFTDIPIITIEYNVPSGEILQAKARVEGEPDAVLSRDDVRGQLLLSAVWEIARSERYNSKTGKNERRGVFAHSELGEVFSGDWREQGVLLWKNFAGLIVDEPSGSIDQDILHAISEHGIENIEFIGVTIDIDSETPDEMLDLLPSLSVNIRIRSGVTQSQLDKITRVNGTVYVAGSRDNDSVNLRNLVYAGGLDIRDNKKFRADKLVEVRGDVISDASENYLKSLRSAAGINILLNDVRKQCVFVAPHLVRGDVMIARGQKFRKYDCPITAKVDIVYNTTD